MDRLFYQWVGSAVIGFILRQVAKFQTTTDWDRIAADAIERVKALIPGTFFDDEAARVVEMLVIGAARALKQEKSLKLLLELVAEEKWPEALMAFKDYLIKAFTAQDLREAMTAEGREHHLAAARLLVEKYQPTV